MNKLEKVYKTKRRKKLANALFQIFMIVAFLAMFYLYISSVQKANELEKQLKITNQLMTEKNGFGLCIRWGFPALKINSSTNFNLSTND